MRTIRLLGKLDTNYGVADVMLTSYDSDPDVPAIVLVNAESGETIAVLSVNLPDDKQVLQPGCFFAKTWSENERIAETALASGLFVDTGLRVPTGYVSAQVWRIVESEVQP